MASRDASAATPTPRGRPFPLLARIDSAALRAAVASALGDADRLRDELSAIVAERRDAVHALAAIAAGATEITSLSSTDAPFARTRTARVILRVLGASLPWHGASPETWFPADRTHDALAASVDRLRDVPGVRALRDALSLAGDGAGGAMLPLVTARIEWASVQGDDGARAYASWIKRHTPDGQRDWLLARALESDHRTPDAIARENAFAQALAARDLTAARAALEAWLGPADHPLGVALLFAVAWCGEALEASVADRLDAWAALRFASTEVPGALGQALESVAAERMATLGAEHPALLSAATGGMAPDDRAALALLQPILAADPAGVGARPGDEELLLRVLVHALGRPAWQGTALAPFTTIAAAPLDLEGPTADALPDPALWVALVAETRSAASSFALDLARWRASLASVGAPSAERAEALELEGRHRDAASLWLALLLERADADATAPELAELAERVVAAAQGETGFYAAALRCLVDADRHEAACALLEIHPLRTPGPGARESIARMLRAFASGGALALRRLLSLALDASLTPRDWRSAWREEPEVRTTLLLELDRLASTRDERARTLLAAIADERAALLDVLRDRPTPDDLDALLAWHRERGRDAHFEDDAVRAASGLAAPRAARLLAEAARALLRAGLTERADALAGQSLALDARQVDANLLRAELAVARGEVEAAPPFYEAAGRNERDLERRASLYITFGDLLRDRLDHVRGATEQYLVAFMCRPDDERVIERLETIYTAEGRFRELSGLWEVALQHAKESRGEARRIHRMLLQRAQIEFERLNHPERAVALLTEAVERWPQSARPLKVLEGPLAAHVAPAELARLRSLHGAARSPADGAT